MNIMVIKSKVPYPLNQGTNIVSYNIIKALCKEHDVTLVTMVNNSGDEKNIKQMTKLCKNVYWVYAPNKRNTASKIFYKLLYTFLSIVTLKPIGAYYSCPPEMCRLVRKITSKERFDLVQVEYTEMAGIAMHINCDKKILLKHDIDYLTIKRAAENQKNFLKKQWLLIKSKLRKAYELRVNKEFSHLLVLSEKDKMEFEKNSKGLKLEAINTMYSFKPRLCESRIREKSIIFIAALGAYFNNDAILYFIEDIFPFILKKEPSIKLYVVGREPSKQLQNYNDNKNIIVTGMVEDVSEYMCKAGAFIVPMRIGTGIKVKIVEALSYSMPIVSTSIGAEGVGGLMDGENILIADTPEEFANKVLSVVNDEKLERKLSDNAYKLYSNEYYIENAYKRLISTYENINTGRSGKSMQKGVNRDDPYSVYN